MSNGAAVSNTCFRASGTGSALPIKVFTIRDLATTVDQECARRLALPLSEASLTAGGLGTTEGAVFCCRIDTLTIQSLRLAPLEVFAIDLAHMNQALHARDVESVDGVIGADILESKSAIIDYKDAMLYLKNDA
jgi:hypothetical protein